MTVTKTVMCFGDSITWGQDPVSRQRLPYGSRWPGVLQGALAGRIRVIEEALCDRTTIWDDPYVEGRNGKAMLGPLLESHAPIDLLAIMLGTNDLQRHFHKNAAEVALGVRTLTELALRTGCGPSGEAPELLVIAPHSFGGMAPMERLYFSGKEQEATALAESLRVVAECYGARFIDASKVVVAGADGIHLDAENHRKLAQAVCAEIEPVLFA
ncbi:MAG: SGNH/GDSL hydrolase family protein [Pseudomonadota bacterium]